MTDLLPEIPDGQTTATTIERLRSAGVLGDCWADYSLVLSLADEEADFDRYESIGRFLASAHDAARWWLADWLIFGEGAFGERFFQAAEATGLSEGTLTDYARIALRVPRSRRRADVHFSGHREVAKLDPEEQEFWLARAADRSLSTRELREEISSNPATSPEPEPESHPVVEFVRVERALLSAIVNEAAADDDPRYRRIPEELIVRLRAAIGEET